MITLCRQAIQLDPRDAVAYNNLGSALQAKGQIEEATEAYRTAANLDPSREAFQSNLKAALRAQGKGKKFLGLF